MMGCCWLQTLGVSTGTPSLSKIFCGPVWQWCSQGGSLSGTAKCPLQFSHRHAFCLTAQRCVSGMYWYRFLLTATIKLSLCGPPIMHSWQWCMKDLALCQDRLLLSMGCWLSVLNLITLMSLCFRNIYTKALVLQLGCTPQNS